MSALSLAAFDLVLAVCAVVGHARILRRYRALAQPSDLPRTLAIHRVSSLTMWFMVPAGLGIYVTQQYAAGFALFYIFAVGLEISAGFTRAKLLGLPLTLKEQSRLSLRANFWIFLGLVAGFTLYHLPAWAGWSQGITALATGMAMVGAFILLRLYSPSIFTFLRQATPLQDPEMLAAIHARLAEAKLPPIQIYVWKTKQQQVANAMVIGNPHARPAFRARMVLTDSLVQDFSRAEVDAIVAHEVSHLSLDHLRRRARLPLKLGGLLLVTAIMTAIFHPLKAFAPVEIPQNVVFGSTMLIGTCLYLAALLFFGRGLVRAQELDADWNAVYRFGVAPGFYFDALDKLVRYAGESTSHRSPLRFLTPAAAHPSNDERRALVTTCRNHQTPPFEAEVLGLAHRRFVYALVLLFLCNVLVRPTAQTPRQPASARGSR